MHPRPEPRWPAPLRDGARIALIAPAGPVRADDAIPTAAANVRALGFTPVEGQHVRARRGYLAGDDATRLADLQWALDDDSIDAIWCVRGGYGVSRLLPMLSFDALRARPKPVIGYSDITALHVAIAREAHLVSIHAHMAGRPLTPLCAQQLHAVLRHQQPVCGTWQAAAAPVAGAVTGRLVGGNLAVLAALAGTPWSPQFRDGIVILEDVGEAAYRVDRMLVQLEQAGAFDGARGVVCGRFTDVPADVAPDAPTCEHLVHELAQRRTLPCLSGVPIGHIAQQWAVPLGAVATLDTDARALHVSLPTLS
jgi:muramoyltetrapeptide carboxypeptidase